MSYEQIQRQRDIANELLRANMSTPQNVGEGLSAIGRALAAKAIDKRTSRADDANRAASEERRASAIGSIFGGSASPAPYAPAAPVTGPTPITFTPETPNPAGLDPSIIGAVDRVAPNAPQAMDAGAIGPRLVADLVRDFNLTPEQAAGVAGNLAHETGGFKHMQEIQPMIPGSRGGFGFAQWTGPRRKAFEAWTAQNGLDPNSYEANYGFLAHELKNTPEGAVLGPLSQAQTPDQAATVFSDQFLRPGIPNNGSRVAFAQQFAQGGQGAPATPAPTGGVDPANIKLIADLLADPYTPPGEKVMLEQAMAMALQGMDPMRQMEMERERIELDRLKNPPAAPAPLSAQDRQFWGIPETDTRPYVMGKDGIPEPIGGGGVTVNNQIGGGAEPLGTEGQILVPDESAPGGVRVEVAKGSKLDLERQGLADKQEVKEGNASIASETVTTAAQRALEAASNRLFGEYGQGIVGDWVPQSDAAEVKRQVGVLKSQAIVGNLQAMRDASPTGGALGAVTAPELQLLADQAGALDPSSPTFPRDLEDYTKTLLRTIHGPEEGTKVFNQWKESMGAATAPDADGWQTINGVKVRVKQ